MGNYVVRRQNARIEEIENSVLNQAYLYPPKSGNYFSSKSTKRAQSADNPSTQITS